MIAMLSQASGDPADVRNNSAWIRCGHVRCYNETFWFAILAWLHYLSNMTKLTRAKPQSYTVYAILGGFARAYLKGSGPGS